MRGFHLSGKSGNMFDVVEIRLIRCKLGHTKTSFRCEITKGSTYTKFDLSLFDLSVFDCNMWFEVHCHLHYLTSEDTCRR